MAITQDLDGFFTIGFRLHFPCFMNVLFCHEIKLPSLPIFFPFFFSMSLFCCRLFCSLRSIKPIVGLFSDYIAYNCFENCQKYFFVKCGRQNSPNVLGTVCNHSGFLHLINKDGGIFPLCADKCDLFAIHLVSSWTLGWNCEFAVIGLITVALIFGTLELYLL